MGVDIVTTNFVNHEISRRQLRGVPAPSESCGPERVHLQRLCEVYWVHPWHISLAQDCEIWGGCSGSGGMAPRRLGGQGSGSPVAGASGAELLLDGALQS